MSLLVAALAANMTVTLFRVAAASTSRYPSSEIKVLILLLAAGGWTYVITDYRETEFAAWSLAAAALASLAHKVYTYLTYAGDEHRANLDPRRRRR